MNQSLVMALLRMGDLLQSFPAIADVSRRQQGRGIALLVQKDLLPVAALHPQVDRIISFDGDELLSALFGDGHWSNRGFNYLDGLVSEIEALHPDTVVNLTHTSFSAHLCGAIRKAEIKGRTKSRYNGYEFHGDWSRYFFTLLSDRSCNPFNIVDIFREISDGRRGSLPDLRVPPVDSQDIAQQIGDSPKRPLIAVGIGANHPLRSWPVENWIAVLSILKERINPSFVLLGGAREIENASAIENGIRAKCLNLCGRTNLSQLACIIEKSDLFMGHDSGPVHLAAMLGKSSVAVYLAMASAWETAAYHQGSVTVEPDLACHPCPESGGCNDPVCHNAISPDAVAGAALNVLGNAKLSKRAGCLYRISDFSLDGRLILRGDRKVSDEKRLFWRNLLSHLLDTNSPMPLQSAVKIDNSILEQQYIEVQRLKTDAVKLAQKSLEEFRDGNAAKWCTSGETSSRGISEMMARYPWFRTIFELYRLDCQMGNGIQNRSSIELVTKAQENLLKRIGIIQSILTNSIRQDKSRRFVVGQSTEKLNELSPGLNLQ